MGKESHYSSKKDRVFVRAIQGQYSLKDELARLRSLPRVKCCCAKTYKWSRLQVRAARARPD